MIDLPFTMSFVVSISDAPLNLRLGLLNIDSSLGQ
jgi:hypothetical protein